MGNYTRKILICKQCGDKFEHYAVRHVVTKIYCERCKSRRAKATRDKKNELIKLTKLNQQ